MLKDSTDIDKLLDRLHLARRKMLRAERLLEEGKADEALSVLAEACARSAEEDAQHALRPARLDLLRGRAMLLRNDSKGVTLLLKAAERDPALLGKATEAVEQWLAGSGAEYDTPLLRHELTRMQALFHVARQERAEADGTEALDAPDEMLAALLREALKPWQDEVRVAWLARRRCHHAPKWRHLELLLEMRPRRWHFQENARPRLEALLERLRRDLPPLDGGIAVRAYPLLALPAHLRNMRKHAISLLTPDEEAEEHAPENPAAFPAAPASRQGAEAKRGGPLPRLMRATALLALALPVWAGWSMLSNTATRQHLAQLEQRHAARMQEHYWLREDAAGMFSPRKTIRAFMDALRAADAQATPAVLDAPSRRWWQRLRHDQDRLRQLARAWAGCGAPRVRILMGHAVALWPREKKRCMPLLLRREHGRWRIAWTETQKLFRRNRQGRWRFADIPPDMFGGWLFAFHEQPPSFAGNLRLARREPGDALLGGDMATPHDEIPPLRQARLLEGDAVILHMPDSGGRE